MVKIQTQIVLMGKVAQVTLGYPYKKQTEFRKPGYTYPTPPPE